MVKCSRNAWCLKVISLFLKPSSSDASFMFKTSKQGGYNRNIIVYISRKKISQGGRTSIPAWRVHGLRIIITNLTARTRP